MPNTMLEAANLPTAMALALDDRENTAGLRATIEFAPVGIAHIAPTGHFLLANAHLCHILGYTREQLLSITFQQITHPDDLPVCVRLTQDLVDGRIPSYQQEKRFVRADGTSSWTRVTVSAVRSNTGEIAFCIGVAEDINARVAAEDARREALALERAARAEAERAIQMREDVLAVVAHDLRDPVQTIVMGTGSLIEFQLPEEQKQRQLDVIKRSAWRMNRLIRDLLDMSRMDAGTFAVAHARVLVPDLVRDLVDTFEPQARARGITFVCDVAPRLPPITGDYDRLLQAISNLVANALKFTKTGGEVRLRARKDDLDLRISVEDTGAGIPEANLAKVFDRFWQADRVAGGAGLGLGIVKGIVDAHGGTVSVESKLGHGTTFHITLPLTAVERRSVPERRS
jgi:PAS domain S-box-containing protein